MKDTDTALQDALFPLFGDDAVPGTYRGKSLEYACWNIQTIPEVHAEGFAHAARQLVLVRYFCPTGYNPNPKKISISQALIRAGFTTPSITPAHDKQGQCWIFECEHVNAGAAYGFT